jgi:lactobin A/cerein 7B family class IIb bacteriocin
MKELDKKELQKIEGGFPWLLLGIAIGLLIGYLTDGEEATE